MRPVRSVTAAAAAAVVVAVAAMLVGCGVRTSYTPLNPPPRELRVRRAAEVPLYTTVPQAPHVEIGAIEAERQANSSAGKEELWTAIRKEAASRGCDAVRIIGRSNGRRYGIQGACIVYKPAVPSQGAAARTATSSRPAATQPAEPDTPTTSPLDAGAEDVPDRRR